MNKQNITQIKRKVRLYSATIAAYAA